MGRKKSHEIGRKLNRKLILSKSDLKELSKTDNFFHLIIKARFYIR